MNLDTAPRKVLIDLIEVQREEIELLKKRIYQLERKPLLICHSTPNPAFRVCKEITYSFPSIYLLVLIVADIFKYKYYRL